MLRLLIYELIGQSFLTSNDSQMPMIAYGEIVKGLPAGGQRGPP